MTEAGVLEMAVGDTPESPPDTGYRSLYPKVDGFYHMDDAGVEKILASSLFGDSSPTLNADLDVNGFDIPGFAESSEVSEKQDTLVSGSTIKTINGFSVLGSGNIKAGRSITGALNVSGSADITLTSASKRVQCVEMSNTDCFVVLPDATTLDTGYGIFLIINGGNNPFKLKDHNGNEISENIESGKMWNLILLNNSESGGVWKFVIWDAVDEIIISIIGTPGTPSAFESASIYYTSIAALSETKIIVAYRDAGNSNYGTACVLDISGSTITPGTPVVFESASITYTGMAALSSTKAIVNYQDGGNSYKGTACVLDVSGTVITPGTPVVFEEGTVTNISMEALSETKAIAAYRDDGNSYKGTACVLDISGSTITPGTPVVFDAINSQFVSVSALSETKVIVSYRRGSSPYPGTACVLDISGTTITPGTPVIFDAANSQYVTVTTLSSIKAIVAYLDAANSNYGTACVLDVSGTVITPGTPVVFEEALSAYDSITALSETKAIVAYQDGGNSNYGTACVLDISGSTITPGTPFVFASTDSQYIAITKLSSVKAAIAYRDHTDSGYGKAAVIT